MAQRFSIIFFILLCVFMFGALVGPKPSDDLQLKRCFTNVVIKPPAIITLNCDSPEFINLTLSPRRIFDEHNIRQSRPGLSFLAYIFTPFFSPLDGLIDLLKPESRQNVGKRAELHPKEDLVAYSALIFLNMSMILLGYWFYQASLNVPTRPGKLSLTTPAFLIGLMLIINGMMKLFILSPHTQLLNITVPILSFWGACYAYYKTRLGTRFSYLFVGTLGLSMLVYANFIVPFAVFMSVCLWQHWQQHRFSRWARFGMHALGMAVLFVLPSVIWYCTVMYITGSYYVHEVHLYSYVSWIRDSFVTGGVLAVLQGYGKSMVAMLQDSAVDFIPTALLFLCTFIWAWPNIRENSTLQTGIKERILLALWIDFMFLGLFASMGFYPPRITYALIPVWWPVIGHIANEVSSSGNTLVSPKIFSWTLGLALGLYALWLLSTPWDFHLW